LITGFKQTGLSLWDEDNKKLISFRQYKKQQLAGLQAAEASA
jgi:hypothetical protein